MKDENYGYSLSQPELTSEDEVQSLRETIMYSKYGTFSYLLGVLTFPYAMEKCYGRFPEPLDSTIYTGLLLLEIIAVGACLHSAYNWYSTSKCVKELEALAAEE